MFWIGVDPGNKSGAIAVISDSGEQPIVLPFTEENLLNIAETYYGKAIIEKIHSMPQQGSVSTFHFGENFGFIQGVLKAKGIPFQLVPPQKWQREFSINSKEDSIATAKRLFLGVNLKATERSKVDNHNFADAILLAEYGRRHNL